MSLIAFHSYVALTFTNTSSRTNLMCVIPLRPRPAKGNLKRVKCCPLVGRHSPQNLAHLHETLKTRGRGRSASRGAGHFLEFVGHSVLGSLEAPSATR